MSDKGTLVEKIGLTAFQKQPAILPEPHARPNDKTSPCSACAVRDISLCSVLSPSELPALSGIMSTVSLETGEVLFDEGEPAEYHFNLTSGAVKLYKLLPDGRRQVTGFFFAGDFIGLGNRELYGHSAEAVGPATLCRYRRRQLDEVLARYPQLEHRLLGIASDELAAAQDQMLLLGRKSARERMATFFLQLSERAVRRGEPADPIYLPMSRADIGDYLGLTTETVSRTVTQLKKSGAIRLLPGNGVTIPDRARLARLADGA